MQSPFNVSNKSFTPLMDLLSPFKPEPTRGSNTPTRSGVYRVTPTQNIPTQNVPTQTTPGQSAALQSVTPQSNVNRTGNPVPFDEDRAEMDWYEKESDEESKQAEKSAVNPLHICLTPQTAKMGFILSELLGEPLSKKRRYGRWR